jgi:hypothetical protein
MMNEAQANQMENPNSMSELAASRNVAVYTAGDTQINMLFQKKATKDNYFILSWKT